MERTQTTFLYDEAGKRFRCDIADADVLMEKKGWKRSPDDFKTKSLGGRAAIAKKDSTD